jgi:hypothetical protein
LRCCAQGAGEPRAERILLAAKHRHGTAGALAGNPIRAHHGSAFLIGSKAQSRPSGQFPSSCPEHYARSQARAPDLGGTA